MNTEVEAQKGDGEVNKSNVNNYIKCLQ